MTDFNQIEMRPERWERRPFNLTPPDKLKGASDSSELTGDLAVLEKQCGYCLSKEFVFQYETDARNPWFKGRTHRIDFYNTRKNALAVQGMANDARVQDELFSLKQMVVQHAKNVAHFDNDHFDGVWPVQLIPIGWDGNGGRLAVEAGHEHFSPVVLLQVDPFETITVANSLESFFQLQRATLAVEMYIALTMMTPAERQSAVQDLTPDGRYSNLLSARRQRLDRN